MHSLIEIKNLDVAYNNMTFLSIDELCIKKNVWTMIHGPSGSGKTTFLNILAGQSQGLVVSGSIELFYDQNTIAYMPQQPCLLESLSIGDNIKILAMLRSKDTAKLDDLLVNMKFNQDLNNSVHNLSGGERMKISLMRALSLNAEVIFLDEPTCHWDMYTTKTVMECLKDYKTKREVSIIMVTHDLSLLEYAASDINMCMYQAGGN